MKRIVLAFTFIACGKTQQSDTSNAPARTSSSATATATTNFIAIPLTGCWWPALAQVQIGGQMVQLLVDTGSASLVVAQNNCTTCAANGVVDFYAPGASATDLDQSVSSDYGGGGPYPSATWSGELYNDTVALGGKSVSMNFATIQSEGQYPIVEEQFCDTTNGWLTPSLDGVLGVGPDANLLTSTSSFLDNVLGGGVLDDAFAIALWHAGGTLYLGGYDPSVTIGPMQYADMTTNNFYNVNWTHTTITDGAKVHTVAMPASAATSIVDSGGTGMYLPKDIFDELTHDIETSDAFVANFSSTWFVENELNCTHLLVSPEEIDAELPTFGITLAGSPPVTITYTATESYLGYTYDQDASSGVTYCPMLRYASGLPGGPDIASVPMVNHVMLFDRANQRVGIAPIMALY